MQALIMMLLNTSTNTYHPILYFENPLPGGPDVNLKVVRFKSKGHRTIGFENREDALNSIQPELIDKCKSLGYEKIRVETETDLPWDGEDIPADVQLRGKN